ncbi:MAG: hypothetical protein JW836_03945 [Deltaproteobacteria bacterium]|nr:hypothetical protein [Deltaproteobacteria bacterium]
MKKHVRNLIILFCFALASLSCSYSKSVYESVAGLSSKSLYDLGFSGAPVLKKRVMVLPFLDQAGLGKEKVDQFTEMFLSDFNANGNYVIHKGSLPSNPAGKSKAPEFGIIADPEEVQKAAEKGMNIMITAVLSPENARARKKGIWPFRRVVADVEIPMIVNAFDVVNGTLCLSHLESVKIETDVEEFDPLFDKDPGTLKYELDPEKVDQAWAQILKRQAEVINRTLEAQPWMGRILSVDSRGAVVNAGEDVGLKTGVVFEVLGKAEIIQSASGRPISLLGPSIGELKVTEIREDHAFAPPLSDISVQKGQLVRIKR